MLRARGALLLVLAAACDARGVRVGADEPCVPSPELAQVDVTPPSVSPCARVGENALQNASFESPRVEGCAEPGFCQFPAERVEGWQTTSEAQVIEVWSDLHAGVPAPAGVQFVELDAMTLDALFQDLQLPAGQLMYWSLLHRGRNGVESVDVRIGPPARGRSQRVLSSPADGWYPHSGLYRVEPDEAITRFELVSLSGAAEGNLVDAVSFAPVQ